jgi:ABC-type bacteriocin/lantibiotic exporter with double-glycine peptidase domain
MELTNTAKLTPIKRFFRLLHLQRRDINYIYLFAIFAGIINLTLPLGIQAILNFLQAGTASSSWWLLIAAVTIGTLLAGILVMMQMSVSETLQRRIFTEISFDFAKRLPNLKTEAVQGMHLPELVNRFFDTLTLQKGLPKILIDVSTAFMQIFFGLVLLSFYHATFIFFGLALSVILGLIFRFSAPIGLKTSLKESKYKYEVAYWLEEVARTLQTFKLAGNSELPMLRVDEHVSNYLDAKKSHFKVLLLQFSAIIGFKVIITFLLLSLGGWLVLNNELNVGQFVAAEIIIILIMNSAEKLIITLETVYDVMTAIEKLGTVADLPIESESGIDFRAIDTGKGIAVELQNLSFQFPDAKKPVLKQLNLKINAGEKICLVGYNGSGKTTLVRIISCFLSNYEGNLIYNGVPKVNINTRSLRAAIGDFSVQEDIFIGSLYENISLGYTHLRFENIVEVCESVGLMGFINGLPDGFDAKLLPGGKNMPRSIVAKIILARSIVSNPKLLAIEELMANLNQNDRINLSEILTDKKRLWTLIAVTDDPELASCCERVIVLQDGQIVADGTYEAIFRTEHGKRIFK